MDPLIVLEHVEKRYPMGETEVTALRDVSLTIPPGEFVVFLGPSGSGKTTLLNLIGGLEKPTAGRLVVAGHDLTGMDEAELTAYRRDVIGFVFQFFNLVPTLTAWENVALIAELVPDALDPSAVLAAVGLADREKHFPAALSGGEQQRVAIARALVKRPALVLADEPTGSLDYETSVRVLKALDEIPHTLSRWGSRDAGHGVLLVTHNQEIARMADRVVRLHSGSVAAVTVNRVKARPEELQW